MKIVEEEKFIGCLSPRYCRMAPRDTLLDAV
jgi:hypothetical protein